MLLQSIIVVSTFLNEGDLYGSITLFIKFISIAMLTQMELQHSAKSYLKILINLFSILLFINFITILVYPDGLYTTTRVLSDSTSWIDPRYWFLGFKNGIGKYILATLCFKAVYDTLYVKKITSGFIFLSIISYWSLIMIWSATSLFTVGLFIIFILFAIPIIAKKNWKIFSMKSYLIITVALFLVIVIFQNSSIFYYLIENIFKKNAITFSGRTFIWNNAFKWIKASPLLGYGVQPVNTVIYMLGGNKHYSDCHNYFINTTFQGGIVALGFLLAIFIMCTKKLNSIRNTTASKIMGFCIFCFFVMFLTENTTNPILWILITLAYHLPEISGQNNSYK